MRYYNLFEGEHALRIAMGITMLALMLAGSSGAATLTVDASGGADYTRIQDAIDNATAGDTIEVYSGTYSENVIVNKQLNLKGIGMPVVDAGGSGSSITLSSGNSLLEGFTVTNAEDGILIGGSNMMDNNIVKSINASNNAHSGIEISCYYNGFSIHINNTILIDNFASNNSIGIFLNGNPNGSMFLCSPDQSHLNNNTASYNNYGFLLKYAHDSNLIGNKATYNTNHGIFIDSRGLFSGSAIITHTDNNLSYNTISNNDNGIYLISRNNTLYDNNISNNIHNGIYLNNSWCSIIYGMFVCDDDYGFNDIIHNKISNNGNGIYVTHSSNNNLKDNSVLNNNNGIILNNSDSNLIYNNYFSNTNNAQINGSNISTWNTTKQSSTNILGGPYLGGNVWSNPTGTGFSQTCSDNDKDGICDSAYTLDSDNIDYLPLTVPAAPTAGSISGFKVNDTNGNGRWNAGEKGISNWTIRLIGITGKEKNAKVIRKETLTDATGFYKFDNLPAGRYFVIEKLKKGFVPTSSPVKRIKLAQGKNSMNNNFTNRPVNSRDNKNDNRDIDDYETINKDIDKYKEDMNWD